MPVPLLLAAAATARPAGSLILLALALILLGESLRLWGVAWIGPRSRTRTAQVGSMVTGGPYRWCRNPLYLGNLFLIAGVTTLSGHPILPALSASLLFLHYSLIIRWEEHNLRSTLGAPYKAWCQQVPRWGLPPRRGAEGQGSADWPSAIRSERSTFLAIAATVVGMALASRCLGS